MATTLETELAAFERIKPDLLSEAGKFAVMSDRELLGVYVSYEDALKIGYEKCGLKPFLVKQIQIIEPVVFFSRGISVPCHI